VYNKKVAANKVVNFYIIIYYLPQIIYIQRLCDEAKGCVLEINKPKR